MSKYSVTKEDRKLLNKMIWKSGLLQGSFNLVKMQGQGFLYSIGDSIEAYYDNDKEAKIEAMERSNTFFNTNLCFSTFVMGIVMALEKKKSKDASVIEGDAIMSIKTSLMGPLAGIGDSFIFNVLRIIAASIGIGLVGSGNVMGAIMYLVLFLIPFYFIKYNLAYVGFTMGTSFIDKMNQSGLLKRITKCASIVGIFMVGALVSQMVNIQILYSLPLGDSSLQIQSILDSILPGLLSILIVFGCKGAMSKGLKPVYLVSVVMILCIILSFFGII